MDFFTIVNNNCCCFFIFLWCIFNRKLLNMCWCIENIPVCLLRIWKYGCVDAYDRRDKPSVLVTSPSSPDRLASGASASSIRYSNRLTPTGQVASDSNVGGRIQIKLGFEPGTLQLILTIICATGLTYRANGATRNPYVKVSLSFGCDCSWFWIFQNFHCSNLIVIYHVL